MSNTPLKIRVITACTGAKSVTCDSPLTFDEVQQIRGGQPVPRALEMPRVPARTLYTGRQHTTLMAGVEAIEGRCEVDLHILSAAYGLVPGDALLYPYEATFSGLSPKKIDAMSRTLGLASQLEVLLSTPAHVTLILLGSGYMRAARLDTMAFDASRTIVLSAASVANLAPQGALFVPLGMPEARRFGATLIALKGLLGARFLQNFAAANTSPALPKSAEAFLALVAS